MILQADSRLIPLKDQSVNCIVCSPPYWSLRKYDIPDLIWDAVEGCEHEWVIEDFKQHAGRGDCQKAGKYSEQDGIPDMILRRGFCLKCGAWKGQLGLEPTVDLYLKHLLSIMDECKRVLRDDGVMFINLGDSYAGSGGAHKPEHANPGLSKSSERGGVPRVPSYDISDKVPEGCPLHDSIWNHPCDGCRAVSVLRNFHKNQFPFDADDPNPEHMEFENDHFPTSDSLNRKQIHQSSFSIEDRKRILNREDGPPLSSGESSFSPSSDESLQNVSNQSHEIENPLEVDSFSGDIQPSVYNVQGYMNDKDGKPFSSAYRNSDKVHNVCPYLNYTTSYHNVKAKSLCLIPERFAIEMVNRGWILRNKIVWHKSNCMPSSVKDRFTVDFEPVFFFVKSKKYWFEQQYDPMAEVSIKRNKYGWDGSGKGIYAIGRKREPGEFGDPDKGRNRRCVWTIPTQPYPESHFATFPEDLVEPMIRAGCPKEICVKCGKAREKIYKFEREYESSIRNDCKEQTFRNFGGQRWNTKIIDKGYTDCGCNAGFRPGIILDPFCGSGTALKVAEKFGRQGIGIDLGYQELSEKRLKWNQVELSL